MIESKFMKEFFIISTIYRTMNNLLKEKLTENNIPLNETQITILFLMHNKDMIKTEDILKMGHFTTSNLLFNINTLNNNNYIHVNQKEDYEEQLDNNINLAKDGKEILISIDKLCKNLETNISSEFINLLSNYQQELDCIKVKHLRK